MIKDSSNKGIKYKRILKKEIDELNKFLYNHTSHIQTVARIIDYRISISQGSNGDNNFKGSEQAIMTMDVDYEYLTASLKYNSELMIEDWRDKNYIIIIRSLCHEISHIITGESFDKLNIKYRGDGKYYQERLTERVGRMIEQIYYPFMELNKIKLNTG